MARPKRAKSSSPTTSLPKRVVLILLPFALLATDFLRYPLVFEFKRSREKLSATSLLTESVMTLGTINAHHVHVALDSVGTETSLNFLSGSPNGLVISVFAGEDGVAEGALLRAVQRKLERISPGDSRRLRDKFNAMNSRIPGEIDELGLKIPPSDYTHFPVDRLFIAVLEHTASGDAPGEDVQVGREVFKDIFPKIIARAAKAGISSLVIPCIGYNWEDKNSVAFDELFTRIFISFGTSDQPANIYISLYSDWPTFTLEEAVSSLNTAWEALNAESVRPSLVLYRYEYRFILLLLGLCLFVCSFQAPLTLKSFTILCIAYVTSALGSSALVQFFTRGQSATVQAMIQVAVWTILALGFPGIVRWDPKEIFKRRKG